MEEFALVEADFQQYYHLNLEEIFNIMLTKGVGFLRYNRLFNGLPSESRIMLKMMPAGNWTWRDETFSRILRELSELKAITFNAAPKKSKKTIEADPQFQPDFVKEAKEEYAEFEKSKRNVEEDAEAMRAFWQSRNPDVKVL